MSDETPKGVTLNTVSGSKDGKVHIKVYKDSIIHRVDIEIPFPEEITVEAGKNVLETIFNVGSVFEHQPGYWQPKEKEKADE